MRTQGALKPKNLKGWERVSWLAEQHLELLGTWKPDLVAFEWYAMNMVQGMVALVELGTILRWFTLQKGFKYVDPTPMELKKFALGDQYKMLTTKKGKKKHPDKKAMIKAVESKWGFTGKSNDEVDAFVAAEIARHIAKPALKLDDSRFRVMDRVRGTIKVCY